MRILFSFLLHCPLECFAITEKTRKFAEITCKPL